MDECRAGNVPAAMSLARRWIPLRPDKKPRVSKWQKPETWGDFSAARAGANLAGFVLGGGFICLDYDYVMGKDGDLTAGAWEMLERLKGMTGDTYIETSQSGRGIHAFYKVEHVPDGFPDTLKIQLGEPMDGMKTGNRLEVYTATGAGRYIAVTGNTMSHVLDVADGGKILPYLLSLSGRDKQKGKQKAETTVPSTAGASTKGHAGGLSASEIPAIIEKSKSGALFKELFYDGNIRRYDNDESSADIALMNMLPFYCGGNAATMEEVFSMSALAKRSKWQERKDYRERTIKAALDSWNGVSYGDHAADASSVDADVFPAMKWPTIAREGKRAFPMPQAWENVEYLLSRAGVSCRYNLLSKQIDFSGNGLDGQSADSAITTIRGMAYKNRLRIGRQDLQDALWKIAEGNRYSPVRDYLRAAKDVYMESDRRDYIHDVFSSCFVLNPEYNQNPAFCEMLLRRWLIGAARIAFNDGDESMQGVLVLQGEQGIGKTRFLYSLLPDRAWGADGISLDPSVKDDVLKVIRLWLVELGELGETLRKEKLDRLKQFITACTDDIRRPYGHITEKIPRTTAFIGTVNGAGFLKDSTGDRRYWVIAVNKVEEMPIDRALLWGQVMYLAFDKKERAWLDSEEIKQLSAGNEYFERVTDEERAILDTLNFEAPIEQWTERTIKELSEEIGFNGRSLSMISRVIRKIARKDKRIRIPTNHHRKLFLLPPLNWVAPE